MNASVRLRIRELIDATPWIDTHEHLVEEHNRLSDRAYAFVDTLGSRGSIPPGWASLITDYALADMISAGLDDSLAQRVRGDALAPREKWEIVQPYFEAARATGYLRAVDVTTERLFGLRLDDESIEEVDRCCRELCRPGYYKYVLRSIANVERCQVNSLEEDPFCGTATPELLDQDLSIVRLVGGRHERAERLAGLDVGSLDDYLDVVTWCFERYGRRAVAVKCQWAYLRTLAVGPVDGAPRREFERLRRGELHTEDRRRVEDFIFWRCLDLAAEQRLPVKLHLGYLDGNRQPLLASVFDHVADVASLVQRRPDVTFVLMHAAWPQQSQVIAMAKHFPNVAVDLCWAWILAPLGTARFVTEFLTSAPATKLLCFGGDYTTVETVVGHAELARRGLELALCELVDRGWLRVSEVLELIPVLMRENAERLLPSPRAQLG